MPVLLVCVDGSASEDEAQACRAHFEALPRQKWTYPPSFVDQVDEVPVITPGEEPTLRTVGVYVELPEPEESSDEAARQDVAALIEAMSQLAHRANIEFAVEHREEEIGSLTGGPADAHVVDKFFGPVEPPHGPVFVTAPATPGLNVPKPVLCRHSASGAYARGTTDPRSQQRTAMARRSVRA